MTKRIPLTAFIVFTFLVLLAACGQKPQEQRAANDQAVPHSRGPSGPPSISQPTSLPPK